MAHTDNLVCGGVIKKSDLGNIIDGFYIGFKMNLDSVFTQILFGIPVTGKDLRPYFGIETLSWLCILGAAPFAAIGFVKYNGMNAEEFVLAYIRSEFLTSKELTFKPTNYYYELLKDKIGDDKKDEDNKKSVQTG